MSYVRRAGWLVVCACAGLAAQAQAQALSDIEVVPLRGQAADLARRDRYECHNWAVAQTGGVPAAGPSREEVEREQRAERTARIITGAGIGAAVGGILGGSRGHRDAADGAVAGGIIGAAAGAIAKPRDTEAEAENQAFMDYFRALSACMNGRGYALSLAGAPD
jgi:outer membrane lipoprotein SlyB